MGKVKTSIGSLTVLVTSTSKYLKPGATNSDTKASKGGGVYNMTSSSFNATAINKSKMPIFVNCVFRNNYALER